MPKKLQHFSILFFIFTLVFFIPSFSHVLGDRSKAISGISQAEDSLEAAYLSVLEAERAGGDISELVIDLNNALEYLTGAKRAFESGEYDKAVLISKEAFQVSKVIADDAIILNHVSEYGGEINFRNKLVLSFVFVFFITLFGFLGWSLFKGYYVRRMMGLRPEVSVDGS